MADVLIVGDGPGGLSAGLFLAKNGQNVTVFGQNQTPMHKALLLNYLGIPRMTGSEFQKVGREQVKSFGGKVVDVEVSSVSKSGDRFTVKTADGKDHTGKYLVLASGTKTALGESFGVHKGADGLEVDRDGHTQVERLYVLGWSTRLRKTQAIISAGQGAAVALEILSVEAGKDVHDFDVVS
jgi:thioredoxin reductase